MIPTFLRSKRIHILVRLNTKSVILFQLAEHESANEKAHVSVSQTKSLRSE